MKKIIPFLTVLLLSQSIVKAEEITPIDDIVKQDVATVQLEETDSSNPNSCPRNISKRSILAGAASFLVWPGIGQAINDNKGSKVATHAIIGGVFPLFRVWSAYDAGVDRKCGYWKGRI